MGEASGVVPRGDQKRACVSLGPSGVRGGALLAGKPVMAPRGTVTNDLGNGCETVNGTELTTPHPTGVAGLARRGWRWWARGGESLWSPGSVRRLQNSMPTTVRPAPAQV